MHSTTSEVFPVTVDYGKTFEEMIAAGRYDRISYEINKNSFPVNGFPVEVERSLELVHYGKGMSTEAALEAIDAQGYRPATIEELLAFGAKYPDLQREFPIVALGSVWRQERHYLRYVVSLGGGFAERGLCLLSFTAGWYWDFRFLVVRK